MFDFKSIDIKSLITEALDIERARKTVVSVQVLLDETASPEFQVFVRSGFSSSSVNSRLTVGYYPSQDISVMEGTDLVVMGGRPDFGDWARSRQPSVKQISPVLVIAEHGNQVIQSAKDAGHPLPSDALISLPAGQPLDEEIKGKLADKIGSWIIGSRPREALVVLVGLSVRSSSARARCDSAHRCAECRHGVLVFRSRCRSARYDAQSRSRWCFRLLQRMANRSIRIVSRRSFLLSLAHSCAVASRVRLQASCLRSAGS